MPIATAWAGLGETCTYVAAILFYLEAKYKFEGSKTCTQRKCEWIMPKFQKNVEHLRIKDIDFTCTKSYLDEMLITGSSNNLVASETEPDTTANSVKWKHFTRS